MDATKSPDVTKMTAAEARNMILEAASHPSDSHDVLIDSLARVLLGAAEQRRRSDEALKGVTTVRHYGSEGQQPEAPATAILYDTAWEMVREGLLRPGPRYFGVLNERPGGFSLTTAGKQYLADVHPVS